MAILQAAGERRAHSRAACSGMKTVIVGDAKTRPRLCEPARII
jgi:hypothetical protein